MNIVCDEFEESELDSDWFRPFITSMLIWQEAVLSPPCIDGLMHSTFLHGVVAGKKNPLFAWETNMRFVHRDVS